MKKIISSLIISVAATFVQIPAIADPITHKVDFICPAADTLANFGQFIAGYGSEILSASTTNKIFFKSKQCSLDVPTYLGNYFSTTTNYDGPSGIVTCSYNSLNPSESSIDISYEITNGKGGRILNKTNSTIRVLFLVGTQR
ncbi:MAG: hypothetical protein H0U75_09555 [Legionella sp.]|nr:hypothetical protein [Legionella sp.]